MYEVLDGIEWDIQPAAWYLGLPRNGVDSVHATWKYHKIDYSGVYRYTIFADVPISIIYYLFLGGSLCDCHDSRGLSPLRFCSLQFGDEGLPGTSNPRSHLGPGTKREWLYPYAPWYWNVYMIFANIIPNEWSRFVDKILQHLGTYMNLWGSFSRGPLGTLRVKGCPFSRKPSNSPVQRWFVKQAKPWKPHELLVVLADTISRYS